MNAANEAAVKAFLEDKIGFYDITDTVQHCMETVDFIQSPDLDTIFDTNKASLAAACAYINKIKR